MSSKWRLIDLNQQCLFFLVLYISLTTQNLVGVNLLVIFRVKPTLLKVKTSEMVREQEGKVEEEWASTAFRFRSNKGICNKSSQSTFQERI